MAAGEPPWGAGQGADTESAELQAGRKPVVEELATYSVTGNTFDPESSLNHRAGYGTEFDADFLAARNGAQKLVRHEESDAAQGYIA
jgi:hypothetical protein